MKRCLRPTAILAGVLCSFAAFTAETGDVDGDGLLTIRDVFLAARGDFDAANGSLDAFCEKPCKVCPANEKTWFWWPSSIYVESLQRTIETSYVNWDTVWKEHQPQ